MIFERLIPFITLFLLTRSYIIYCPCMGRFGNQADQFLGTLYFAKQINRTLVLPPWIEYVNHIDLYFRPLTSLFQLSLLKTYHSVVPMENFMKDIAPSVWPEGNRKVFCYSYRSEKDNDCAAKDGRPFGNFWNHFNVNFDSSVTYKPLTALNSANDWISRFPIDKFPVLAFMGAPGMFPIQPSAVPLHKYLRWTPEVDEAVEKLIADNLERPYVAIHLRNDIDFTGACDSLVRDMGSTSLFDSAQCHGYDSSAKLTLAQCAPPDDLVVAHTRQMMNRVGATALYVATDHDDLASRLQTALGSSLRRFSSSLLLATPHFLDLALLGGADGAVLNCVSSFSAFARRERDVRGLPTEYFAFSPLRKSEL